MAKSDKGTILYVGGLNESVKKEEIEKEFERFGKLNRVWVAFNPPGFAFVEYENKDDAEKAVNAMHSAMVFGSRLRVEISRGRGGGRGGSRDGFSSRGRGGFRGGRDFGGRGSDFGGRGRGGRGGFNRGSPYDRNEPMKPFRGGGMGGRFDDFADRRRDFGPIRDFDDRGFGASRDFRSDDLPRGFGAGRDDFPSRDYGHGGRDFPPSRDLPDRDFSRRDFGSERPVNGAARSYGNLDPLDRGFNGRDLGGGRDFGGAGQTSLGARGFGSTPAPRRESGGFADYGADRDIGMRREAVRDFNPPRDLGSARDFGARPSRVDDYTDDRYGAAGRGGFGEPRAAGGPGAGFASARYAGADIDGSADYGGFGARDRFRSRSPIGRVSRPLY